MTDAHIFERQMFRQTAHVVPALDERRLSPRLISCFLTSQKEVRLHKEAVTRLSARPTPARRRAFSLFGSCAAGRPGSPGRCAGSPPRHASGPVGGQTLPPVRNKGLNSRA